MREDTAPTTTSDPPPTSPQTFSYEECEIPAGMTIGEYRAELARRIGRRRGLGARVRRLLFRREA